MEPELPLKSVVLFIACGTMAFIIVFIFAKRQITRYALKSRGPHISIGYDAPKSLRHEIERRLKTAANIQYEPTLLPADSENYSSSSETCRFLYRMKAVDAIVALDDELLGLRPTLRRKAGLNLRTFLLELHQPGGPLETLDLDTVHRFVDTYEHARHGPGEFQQVQYQEYMDTMSEIIEHIRNRKNKREEGSGTNKEDGELLEGLLEEEEVEVDELGQEAVPPLASPDTLDGGLPPVEVGREVGEEEEDSSNNAQEDDEVQVTYRPLTSDEPRPGKHRGKSRGGNGSSHSLDREADNGNLVDQGDEVSLCSGSSRSSSHLETQV